MKQKQTNINNPKEKAEKEYELRMNLNLFIYALNSIIIAVGMIRHDLFIVVLGGFLSVMSLLVMIWFDISHKFNQK